MPVRIDFVQGAGEKSALCADVIKTLPDWFGILEANENYIAGMANRDVFAAYVEGQPVGLIALKYHFNETAEIWWMGIKPGHHRQGIGQELFATAKGHAAAKGCRQMIVNTLSARSSDEYYARTRVFYLKMGFRPLFEDHGENPVNPMMWMILPLAP